MKKIIYMVLFLLGCAFLWQSFNDFNQLMMFREMMTKNSSDSQMWVDGVSRDVVTFLASIVFIIIPFRKRIRQTHIFRSEIARLYLTLGSSIFGIFFLTKGFYWAFQGNFAMFLDEINIFWCVAGLTLIPFKQVLFLIRRIK